MEKAVAELLRPEYLAQAAGFWGGTADHLELIGEVENFVYKFRAQDRQLVLRLTHSTHRTPDLVRGELDWIDYLHRHRVNVIRPVLSGSGEFVRTIPASDGSSFIATAFDWAPGDHVRRDSGEWTPELFRSWGRITGMMHARTKDYLPSDPAIRRPSWADDDLLDAERHLPALQEQPRRIAAQYKAWLRELPADRDSYGLIHTDLHLGNFFLHQGEIIAFDFDDASYYWFIFDIVIPIYYLLIGIPADQKDAQKEFVREFFSNFMAGYEEHNRLDPFWFSTIHRFLRYRDLQLYIFCHKKFDFDNLTARQRSFFDRVTHNLGAGDAYDHLEFRAR